MATEQNTESQKPNSSSVQTKGALDGVRIIDLTRVLSGPFCTQMLGDHGAEVIKIEPPEKGDVVRGQGWIKNDLSWYFAQFNRNKKSITLNLRSDEGKEILSQLLESADVLVENFRPGVMAKMGFSDDYLQSTYPKLIVARINGFGSEGPYKDRPAYDFIAQAMSGFIGVNGDESSGPMRAAAPVSDLIAGTNLAFGISAALVKRSNTGKGDIIETALTNGLISMMSYLAAEYFATGEQPKRTGNDHPILYPYGLFETADHEVAIAPSNDIMVTRLLTTLDLMYLLEDERFATNEKRMLNKEPMREAITEVTIQKNRDQWIDILNKAGIPCGKIFTLEETLTDAQVLSQEMVLHIDQGKKGLVPTTGIPVKFKDAKGQVWLPVPELGEHNSEVYSSLGISVEKELQLKQKGVI